MGVGEVGGGAGGFCPMSLPAPLAPTPDSSSSSGLGYPFLTDSPALSRLIFAALLTYRPVAINGHQLWRFFLQPVLGSGMVEEEWDTRVPIPSTSIIFDREKHLWRTQPRPRPDPGNQTTVDAHNNAARRAGDRQWDAWFD